MIISNIYGGLGNQMFQYAVGKKLSLLHEVDYKLDINKMDKYNLRDFLLDKYNISAKIGTKEDIARYKRTNNVFLNKVDSKLSKFGMNLINNIYYEKKPFEYDASTLENVDVYLDGYWQSYKYFDDIRDILLKEFNLLEALDVKNTEILDMINSSNSISLHIRRGDYVTNAHTNNVHGTCSLDYYQKAIKIIDEKVQNTKYFIFSDDIEWAKNNLKFENVKVYIDINSAETPFFDLALMKSCKHNIIANSTFSWWGAWLNQNNNKIVIAPKKWINLDLVFDDLIPETWIQL